MTARGAGGFTLIELIVVLTVMGVALAIVPFFLANRLPSVKLKSATRELSATIRHARSMALARGVFQVVTVDLEGGTFGIEGRGAKSIPDGIGVKTVAPGGREATRGIWRVVFTPRGGIRGSVRESVVFFTGNGREMSVVIDPVVGSSVVKGGG